MISKPFPLVIFTAAGIGFSAAGGATNANAHEACPDPLLASDGAQLAPLRHFRPRVVRRNPFNFGNVSDNNANPVITPNGRYVVFSSKDNLDCHDEDVTPETFEDEDIVTHDVFRRDFSTESLLRVSVDADGDLFQTAEGELAVSTSPAVSRSGRLVAFATDGVPPADTNGSPGEDTNDSGDVYLKDLVTGRIRLVSAGPFGGPAAGGVPVNAFDGTGPAVAMSASGRFVAFLTTARLDPDLDDNELLDVYVRDLSTGQIFLASLNDQQRSGGVADPSDRAGIAMSANGRFVAFTTAAALRSEDTNEQADVYLWDRRSPLEAPVLVSGSPPAPSGFQNGSLSSNPALSRTGRFVAFESSADLVGDDFNGLRDVYRYDLVRNQTVRVSLDREGRETEVEGSFDPTISANGRFVGFSSAAGDLVLGDTSFGFTERNTGFGYPTDFPEDIFVKDLRTGGITRASVDEDDREAEGTSFSPSISANGRLISFLTDAPNILRPGTDAQPGDSVTVNAVSFDLPGPIDVADFANGAVRIERNFILVDRDTRTGEAIPERVLDYALRNRIDHPGDRDWFQVHLFTDRNYTLDLEGSSTGQGTLDNPLLRIVRVDAGEVELASDDDSGEGLNARLEFRPTEEGIHCISAEAAGGATGTYRLVVREGERSP